MGNRMTVKKMIDGLSDATERVMNAITDHKGNPCGNVGVFVIDGKLITTKQASPAYEKHVSRFADCMVGTYNAGADARDVRADLELFA
jgi:hypothetical protein